jgi:NAD-dependent SIR2 family protein deacetylase
MEFRNIVVLTGAGISADSGLATFRGAEVRSAELPSRTVRLQFDGG